MFSFWHDAAEYWKQKQTHWRHRKSLTAWAAAITKEVTKAGKEPDSPNAPPAPPKEDMGGFGNSVVIEAAS